MAVKFMKVLLLEIKARSGKKCINKDLAGGMGTGTWVGQSWRARIFEFVKRKSVILPEVTLPYLASIFKQAGWEVARVEIGRGNEVPDIKADLALIPSSIVDCQHELEIIKIFKEKGLNVGVFGSFVSAVPEFFLKNADFIIKGEPEAGALKIVAEKALPKGILTVTPVQNLDELPFPDWSLFPINKYSYSPALNKKPVLVMLTSRGCPHSCSFYCPYTFVAGRQWRTRSLENILSELEYLKNNFQVKAIDFRDPVFTLNRQRVLDFCKQIIDKNFKIIWSCESRLDCLDKELLEMMFQAGLRNINVGIESSDATILTQSHRLAINNKHQEEIVNFCHQKGINVAAFYILGLDGDTEKSIRNTVAYAKKLNTLVAQFASSTPYPGTSFYQKIKDNGLLINDNWEDYDEYTPVFRHKILTPQQLLSLKEWAFNSYYFRPAYLLKHMPKYFFEKFLWPF